MNDESITHDESISVVCGSHVLIVKSILHDYNVSRYFNNETDSDIV